MLDDEPAPFVDAVVSAIGRFTDPPQRFLELIYGRLTRRNQLQVDQLCEGVPRARIGNRRAMVDQSPSTTYGILTVTRSKRQSQEQVAVVVGCVAWNGW